MKTSLMSLGLSLGLLIALPAFALTKTYQVEGMHCGGCAKMIQSKVCKLPGIEKCDVSMGKMVLTTKDDANLSDESLQSALSAAGDYKLGKSTLQK